MNRQGGGGQRIDGEVVGGAVTVCGAVRGFARALTSVAATRALGAFALLAFRRQHVQRDQEQDDAAGDLEGGFGDVEIGQDPGPAQREEQHDGGGDGGALERGAQLAGAVLRFGHGKEDRRVADRVDHDEIDDEGGDKALEHASVISRGWWGVHPCKGDICVKARARDDGPKRQWGRKWLQMA